MINQHKSWFPPLIAGLLVFYASLAQAQVTINAPSGNGETNYQWYSGTVGNAMLISGQSNVAYTTNSPGVYFATYDGGDCGSGATDYTVIVQGCNANKDVTLDVGSTVGTYFWYKDGVTLGQTGSSITVVASQTPAKYYAEVTSGTCVSALPTFTVINLDDCGDSDNDGIPDLTDNDSDNDGIPDLTEGTSDSDGDGKPDYLDIDSDNDGIPDIIEAGGIDANGDGLIDGLNPNGTLTADVNNDGLSDIVDPTEGGTPLAFSDFDSDGLPDAQDIDADDDGIVDIIESQPTFTGFTQPSGNDTDNDGWDDAFDTDCAVALDCGGIVGDPFQVIDTDGDGQLDYEDLDSDNDEEFDIVEGNDFNGDGIADVTPTGNDSDNDGLDDAFDTDGTSTTNNGGALNSDLPTLLPNVDGGLNERDYREGPDTDGDDIFNALDSDVDNDGIPNEDEGFAGNPYADADQDGIPNYFDNDFCPPSGINSAGICSQFDTDGDGIPDFRDLDSDNDGIPDIIEAGGIDTNQDGEIDYPTTGVPTSMLDFDQDGLGDDLDITEGGTPHNIPNTDGTGGKDPYDIDADDDGLVDNIEGQPTVGYVPPTGQDDDDDGIDNAYDVHCTGNCLDNTGLNATIIGTPITPTNSDTDLLPDYQDTDSDNADENDLIEGHDYNGDGIADTTPTGNDSDNDGLDDAFDADGTSTTDNGGANNGGTLPNTLPNVDGGTTERDFREPGNDNDGDGIPDVDDLDDDNDGITDIVENLTASNNGDTDGDGIPDQFDLDADNDGINDVIEANGTDINNDGIADGIVGTTPTTEGIPASAGTGWTPPNTDNDGAPDFQDLDADNDGLSDLVESGDPLLVDANDDGVVDGPDTDGDGIRDSADDSPNFGDNNSPLPQNTDNDGQPNYRDLDSDDPTNTIGDGNDDIDESGNAPLDVNNDGQVDPTADIDNDGIDDSIDGNVPVYGGLGKPDTDGDGIPDIDDLDDDNDGITDVVENLTASNDGDTDGDGIPDHLDLDSDNDGINDVIEAGGTDANNDGFADGPVGTTPTTNGIPASAGTGLIPPNTDGTGAPDFQDLDADDDNVPDIIESGNPNLVDTNGDNMVDSGDPDGDGIQNSADGSPNFGDANDPIPQDTDTDNIPNYQDIDDDDDNILTINEDTDGDGKYPDDDTDGDGVPDYLDPDTFVRVAAKAFLQGAYNQFTGLMRDDLRNLGYLPTTEPYSELSYPHTGGGGSETVNQSVLNVTGSDAIVDWVILELRDQVNPSTVVATRSALVQRDGDIVDTNGISPVVFLNIAIDNYYLVVKHRNHLGTMIDLPVALTQDITTIDFTSATQDNYQLIGAGSTNYPQKEFSGGNTTVKALWAGNVDFNDRIIFQGSPVDQDGIFFGVLLDPNNNSLAANYIQEGYNRGDVNMDGTAIFQGSPNDTDIIFFNVVGHPENTGFLANFILIEQIP